MKRAVTLTEVLIVVVILGILGGLATPYYFKAVEKSKQSEALVVLGDMRAAILRYYFEQGDWPQTESQVSWGGVDSAKYFDYGFIFSRIPYARAIRNSTDIGPFSNYVILMYTNGYVRKGPGAP